MESSAKQQVEIDDLSSEERASAQIRIEQHSYLRWRRAKAWKQCQAWFWIDSNQSLQPNRSKCNGLTPPPGPASHPTRPAIPPGQPSHLARPNNQPSLPACPAKATSACSTCDVERDQCCPHLLAQAVCVEVWLKSLLHPLRQISRAIPQYPMNPHQIKWHQYPMEVSEYIRYLGQYVKYLVWYLAWGYLGEYMGYKCQSA